MYSANVYQSGFLDMRNRQWLADQAEKLQDSLQNCLVTQRGGMKVEFPEQPSLSSLRTGLTRKCYHFWVLHDTGLLCQDLNFFFFSFFFLTIIDLKHYTSSRCIRKWSCRTITFSQQLGPQSLKLSVWSVLSQGATTSVATTEEKVSSLLPLSYHELWVCLCACLPGWQSPGHMPFLELQEKPGKPVSSFFLSCSSPNLDS